MRIFQTKTERIHIYGVKTMNIKQYRQIRLNQLRETTEKLRAKDGLISMTLHCTLYESTLTRIHEWRYVMIPGVVNVPSEEHKDLLLPTTDIKPDMLYLYVEAFTLAGCFKLLDEKVKIS